MANNHRWERWSSSRKSSVHGNCLPEAIRPTNPVAMAWKKLPVPATIAVVPHSELEAVPQTRLSVAFASAIQTYNIIVSRSPDSGCQVVDLIDWQHTSMMPPSLPEDSKDLKAALRGHTKYLYRCRLVHYHYITSTTTSSTTLPSMTPLYSLRGRLFEQASVPWKGENFDLQIVLIEAMERWEELVGGGVSCPTKFDTKNLFATMMLIRELSQADRISESWWAMARCSAGTHRYAVAFSKKRRWQRPSRQRNGRKFRITGLGKTKKSIYNECNELWLVLVLSQFQECRKMSKNPSWERSSSFFYCGPCSRLLFLSDYIRLSTTVVANALLECKGHKHALLITKGFKNLLLTGNQSRPKIFDLNIRHPSPLYSKVLEVVRGSSGEAVKISVSSSSALPVSYT